LFVLAASLVDRLSAPESNRNETRLALAAGLAAGAAVVTEFPAAPMAVLLAIVLGCYRRPWRSNYQVIGAFTAGAIAMACVLATYNAIAFGSPIHLGYASVQGFDGMKKGVFGITWPHFKAVSGIAWGRRGLLHTAPLALLGLLGHLSSILRRRHVRAAWICVACAVYLFLLNASYAYWDGGYTYGPRHMATALPLMSLGIASIYDAVARRLRIFVTSAVALGSLATLTAVSVSLVAPWKFEIPFVGYYWPNFWQGAVAIRKCRLDAGGNATNLGVLSGLEPRYSLIPYFAALAIVLFGLLRSLKRDESASPDSNGSAADKSA
jgi:hypothetical protein